MEKTMPAAAILGIALLAGAAGEAPRPAPEAPPAVLEVPLVESGPTIDGDDLDPAWARAASLPVAVADLKLVREPRRTEVAVKACRTEREIFLSFRWKDATKDDQHKPWTWNEEKKEYEPGPEIEDVLAVAFELEGPFTGVMVDLVDAKWDVWHWKAARTNPAGFAMDKTHVFTTAKPEGIEKVKEIDRGDGTKVWIQRPEDAGTSATGKVAKPAEKKEPRIPQYVAQAPSDSAADVRAKGAWKDGAWCVEFARALDTGHPDDAKIIPGTPLKWAISIFDREEDEKHQVSGVMILKP